MGDLSFNIICFALYSVHGIPWQVYWDGLPFPPPVDHFLSEPSAMTNQSLVALHSMTPNFIELHKPLHHNKAVINEGEKFPS